MTSVRGMETGQDFRQRGVGDSRSKIGEAGKKGVQGGEAVVHGG